MPAPKLKKLPAKLRSVLARTDKPAADHRIPGTLEVRAAGEDSIELLVYGNIGDSWWDETVTAKSVVEQLRGFAGSQVTVRINSYGGSVTDGIAIYNELRSQSAKGVTVDVQVDGVAASIASLIAMAGDTITMPDNTLMMLHAPWGFAYGNSAEIREYADVLDTYGKAMATSYARKTGKDASEFEAMWAAGKDNWYTADEAVAFGLADKVVDAEDPEDDDETEETAAAAFQRMVARAPLQIAAQVRELLPRVPAPTPIHPNTPASASAIKPALPGATTHGDTVMTEEEKKAAAEAKAAADKAAADALAALRTRNTEITALATPHFGNAEVKALHDRIIAEADPAITADDVGKQILAILAKGRESLAGDARVIPGADDRDKNRVAMAKAIDIRTGQAKSEGDNPFRGFTLSELARACAERAGVNCRGMDRMEIVGAAFTHSSSDFPQLLGDAAHKALLAGYNDAPESFQNFTRAVSLSDFKPTTLAGLGLFSDLDVVPENGEYKHGTFSETGAPLQLVTYGKMFGISRQAIINDDLNALSAVPRKMGAAAKRKVGDAVFAILTGNPTMADGKTLFHADHNNLVGAGTVLSTTSVDGLRVLMATQTDPSGKTIRVPLKYLVVPMGLGGLARTILESQFEVGAATKNNTTPNIVRNSFEVVEDPRLDASSSTAWYGVADPNLIDGIAVGYLDGKQAPYMEQKEGWNVDGTSWKVRIDAAAAAVDHRGLSKNPGA